MCTRIALVSFLFANAYAAATASAATISGTPDPVQVCDGSGMGLVTVAWNAADVKPATIEVRVGSPTGTLFAGGSLTGSAVTGKWAANGTTFFLVNAANKEVLAKYSARLTTAGCPAPEPKSFWSRLFGK